MAGIALALVEHPEFWCHYEHTHEWNEVHLCTLRRFPEGHYKRPL